ncbi:MAG: hypothetical protein ONB31_15055 [candidate division KSB1 bacterium]|nr:hypothetical protein [candidate division KSB1 bacterium]MDZ7339730.1 hypothetical protein [candidate division KSB1 bacterium]
MLTTKRVVIATICGFVFGIVCMLLASSNPNEPISTVMKWTIIFSRTMLGFTIGISAIRLNWWLHGIVLGAIASLPMAIPIINRPAIAISTIVMGIIYGFLTELITSIFFKAKSAARS